MKKTIKKAAVPAKTRKKSAAKSGDAGEGLRAPKPRPPVSMTASEDARRLALGIAGAGLEAKAAAIEILDVTGKVDYTELLVLMSGRSDRHVQSIAKGIEEALRVKLGAVPLSVEGLTAGQWVLLDFNDVVVHVFQQSTRYYYDLEGLWIDASRLKVPEPAGASERPRGD